MNVRKYQTIYGFASCFGYISMPTVSTPRYIIPAHPSVVVKMKRVLIALTILSKFDILLVHDPPLSRQSAFVII